MAKALTSEGYRAGSEHPKPSTLRYRHSPLQRCLEGIGLTKIVLMTWEEAGCSCGASEVTRAVRPRPSPTNTAVVSRRHKRPRRGGLNLTCAGFVTAEPTGGITSSVFRGAIGIPRPSLLYRPASWVPGTNSSEIGRLGRAPPRRAQRARRYTNPMRTGPIWVAKSAFYFRTYSSILELGMEIQNQGRNSK